MGPALVSISTSAYIHQAAVCLQLAQEVTVRRRRDFKRSKIDSSSVTPNKPLLCAKREFYTSKYDMIKIS